jgi:hypothetical protein
LELNGFSLAEITQQAGHTQPFLPDQTWLSQARSKPHPEQDVNGLYQPIWRGSYPRVVTEPDIPADIFTIHICKPIFNVISKNPFRSVMTGRSTILSG